MPDLASDGSDAHICNRRNILCVPVKTSASSTDPSVDCAPATENDAGELVHCLAKLVAGRPLSGSSDSLLEILLDC